MGNAEHENLDNELSLISNHDFNLQTWIDGILSNCLPIEKLKLRIDETENALLCQQVGNLKWKYQQLLLEANMQLDQQIRQVGILFPNLAPTIKIEGLERLSSLQKSALQLETDAASIREQMISAKVERLFGLFDRAVKLRKEIDHIKQLQTWQNIVDEMRCCMQIRDLDGAQSKLEAMDVIFEGSLKSCSDTGRYKKELNGLREELIQLIKDS